MSDHSNLTLERLREAWRLLESLRPAPFYYATEEVVPRGQVLHFLCTEWGPEWWLFHPDDLAAIQHDYPDVHFIHLRDYKPTREAIARTWQALRDHVNKDSGL